MKKTTLLILAAGLGSRYGSLKQLNKFGPYGETLLDYAIYDAQRSGINHLVFIIRKSIEEDFREYLLKKLPKHLKVDLVFQEIEKIPPSFNFPERKKPWGTGHAVLMAKDVIENPFLVINADDFYGHEAYHALNDFLQNNQGPKTHAMIGYPIERTLTPFGPVNRGVCEQTEDGFLKGIRETKNIAWEKGKVMGPYGEIPEKTFVSMNIFGFMPSIFDELEKGFEDFLRHQVPSTVEEFFIPLTINEMVREGRGKMVILPKGHTWFGVTYKEDDKEVRDQINSLLVEGVYPKNLWNI